MTRAGCGWLVCDGGLRPARLGARRGAQRGQLVSRFPRATGDQQRDGTHQAGQQHQREAGEPASDASGVGKDDVQPMSTVVAVQPSRQRVRIAPAGQRRAHMPDACARDDHHPMTGQVDPPAEVDVLAQQLEPWVEAAQRVPHVPAHECARSPHGQHISGLIMLSLVELEVLEVDDPPPRSIGRQADIDQSVGVLPVDGLRTQERRAGIARGVVEQHLQRIRVRRAVVVQQPDPVSPLALGRGHLVHLECGLDRRAVAGVTGSRQHRGAPRCPRQQRSGRIGGSGVDRDEVVRRAGLGCDCGQGVRQPPRSIVRDQHAKHMRRRPGSRLGLLVDERVVDEERLEHRPTLSLRCGPPTRDHGGLGCDVAVRVRRRT
jgi:hypothetical protein